jgi:hypothetical protein
VKIVVRFVDHNGRPSPGGKRGWMRTVRRESRIDNLLCGHAAWLSREYRRT